MGESRKPIEGCGTKIRHSVAMIGLIPNEVCQFDAGGAVR